MAEGQRTGQQLGNYRLAHLLGAGGFAEVYLGEHVHLGTQAAIKILHTRLQSEDAEVFLAEARTVAHLRHQHIVRVLDFGIDGSIPYLVMDYAPRGSLRSRHPRGEKLPLALVLSYVRQLGDALQYAHDRKLIHRDLKPENVLVDENLTLVLSDFGIATLAQSSRSQNTQDIVGTAAYMAPEQLQGKPRLASDQYSFGIMAYEWLGGTPPFRGTFTEIASQHLLTPPPPLREKRSDLPLVVEQVLMTALAKDPHQRFGSIKVFTLAFEQAGEQGLIGLQEHHIPTQLAPTWPTDTSALGLRAGGGSVPPTIPANPQVQPVPPVYPLQRPATARAADQHQAKNTPGIVRAPQPVAIPVSQREQVSRKENQGRRLIYRLVAALLALLLLVGSIVILLSR